VRSVKRGFNVESRSLIAYGIVRRVLRGSLVLAMTLYVLPVVGCGCSGDKKAGLILEVTDARTGAPLASEAVVTATDGAFMTRLYARGDDPTTTRVAGLHEREGTYRVRVERKGYRSWTRNDIVVSNGFCDHVKTVTLDVEMTPLDKSS
jgi:hypothetical protein